MSGGSYNYLCHRYSDEFIIIPDDLYRMAQDLETTYPLSQAARDTNDLLNSLIVHEREVSTKLAALQEVWKAMEWWRSGDFGKDTVDDRINRYGRPDTDNLMSWIPRG